MSAAVQAMLLMARSFLFVREEPAGSNAGQAVEAFLRFVGLGKGNPWCCAYQVYCVHHAHPGIAVPKTAGCAVMAEWAQAHKLTRTTLAAGDWVLIWHDDLHRVAHIVLVVTPDADGHGYTCVEGNAADPTKPATREGTGAFEGRHRKLDPRDIIVRWSDLLAAAA